MSDFSDNGNKQETFTREEVLKYIGYIQAQVTILSEFSDDSQLMKAFRIIGVDAQEELGLTPDELNRALEDRSSDAAKELKASIDQFVERSLDDIGDDQNKPGPSDDPLGELMPDDPDDLDDFVS